VDVEHGRLGAVGRTPPGDGDSVDLLDRFADRAEPPVLYVHGVPNSSEMWDPFLVRTGGIAVDLPGFGRSAKRADLDYSIAGYDRFLERFLAHLGVERFQLVCHDWGAVGLALAQRRPERVERLVLLDPVPLLPGYRWHSVARIWRRRLVGELAMGATTRWGVKRLSRQASPRPGGLPDDFVDGIWRHFDQGTQRAILRLYRSAPPEALAEAGAHLDRIAAPVLIVWGDHDPYIDPRFADAYANRLPDAEVRHVTEGGHWPWLEEPGVVDQTARFLSA
jgi:pimeloyl-ACP methyl ester carboxylesterase